MSATSPERVAAANSLWLNVAKAVQEGKDPQIAISYKWLVQKPKGRPGRPKKLSKERPFKGHVSSPLFGSKHRPVCANPKCKQRLKRDQFLVCSLSCKEDFKIFAEEALAILFPEESLTIKIATKPKEVPIVPIRGSNTSRA